MASLNCLFLTTSLKANVGSVCLHSFCGSGFDFLECGTIDDDEEEDDDDEEEIDDEGT
eukprot:CAMPEP_0114394774 /NCGR_PEP_ID=MMETSP0102-20121206/12436_1 /TAXON_ID=38822 ORGANISM="Pteridomonas danica, Strain PT" /NCGR_SAMPLE_ID=MMETSP0102 /ASSEMBLY_ACC=CAM_ASM_000212 /LENGTH=57 /DNA_ID=CAMNT_0001554893 /DNA_START=139 /DNA_END=312 /DNA_ORIENTATION=+